MAVLQVTHTDGTATVDGGRHTVVLTVTAPEPPKNGPTYKVPVNVVLVVDTSGSMSEEGKLDQVQQTLRGIIKGEWVPNEEPEPWLHHQDKLCIICFDDHAQQKFPTKPDSQNKIPPMANLAGGNIKEVMEQVDGLQPGDMTNIKKGLELAVQKIKDQRDLDKDNKVKNRADMIILLSDGFENCGDNARNVDVHDIHVDTLGFGANPDCGLLKAISDKSDGGAYYNVTKPTTLNTAISSPLAYIKNIVAKDLEITLTMEQKVSKITVPNFREKPGQNGSGSKTFHIGSVVRDPKKPLLITVEFDLPPAPARPDPQTVMSYKWNYWRLIEPVGLEESPEAGKYKVHRVSKMARALIVEPEVVRTEKTRLSHLAMIQNVKTLADKGKFDDAQDALGVAMDELENFRSLINDVYWIGVVDGLRAELDRLFVAVDSEENYKTYGGQSTVVACISSHERQRYVARGDEDCRIRLFATERMNRYLDEVIEMDKKKTHHMKRSSFVFR